MYRQGAVFMANKFSNCKLCPRECGADRTNGQVGYCRASDKLKVARAALHFWEEPCISGTHGSGTVFFSHCTLGCVFCQNGDISRGGKGIEISPERLCEIFFELESQGAHNINLVTPSHYLPSVIKALDSAKKQRLSIPIVYNCGGYEKPDTVKALAEYVDIWLPDFKYFSPTLGLKYSAAADYPEKALAAIAEMVNSAGPAKLDDNVMMQSGVLVRHLLLPGKLADSMKAVELLYDRFGDDIIISLMSQYTPPCHAPEGFEHKFPELLRTVNPRHYEALVNFAAELGITRCYVQDGQSADSAFIPPFNGEGVLSPFYLLD